MPKGQPLDSQTKATIRRMSETCSKNAIAKKLGISRITVIRVLKNE